MVYKGVKYICLTSCTAYNQLWQAMHICLCVTAPLQICVHSHSCAFKMIFFFFSNSNTVYIMIFCINGSPSSFLSLSLPYPPSSTSLQMSHLPPGCARVLSGWCHGCVWDDDLWLRVCPYSLLFLPPNTSLKWGWGWGCLTDGPLLFPVMLTWADLCQDFILSPVIIYFTKDVNLEQKERDLFRRTSDYMKDSNYLNWIFCTVFLSAKHRGQQSVWRNSTWTVLDLFFSCVWV